MFICNSKNWPPSIGWGPPLNLIAYPLFVSIFKPASTSDFCDEYTHRYSQFSHNSGFLKEKVEF
jgi:hypothetical protein